MAVHRQLRHLFEHEWREVVGAAGMGNVWLRWVNFEERQSRHLYELIVERSRYDIGYGVRALALLLTPQFSILQPMVWWRVDNRRVGVTNMLGYSPLDLRVLPDELVPYAQVLLQMFAGWVKASPQTFGREVESLRISYSGFIQQLLTRVSDEDAQVLLELFDLEGPYTWGDDGCWPYESLMWDPSIDTRWKVWLDLQIRTRIVAEIEEVGNQPDQRTLLRSYVQAFTSAVNQRSGIPYEYDLIRSQLEFILDQADDYGSLIICSHAVATLYQLFREHNDSEMALRLARFAVLGPGERRYVLFDNHTLMTAYAMARDLGLIDPRLRDVLQQLIETEEERQVEKRATLARRDLEEGQILASMRPRIRL